MKLLTDDMDIRDTTLEVEYCRNGDYYLSLRETINGEIIKLTTRIAMSGGVASTRVKLAISELYMALNEN